MKKTIYVIILVSAVLSSCLTDKKYDREITADMIDNPSKIEFVNPNFNFGKVAVGSSVEHTFKFKNTEKLLWIFGIGVVNQNGFISQAVEIID